jgi:hypothetical protein
MGVFRRHQPASIEEALRGLTIRTDPRRTDAFAIHPDKDGVAHETCWFCGAELEFDVRAPTGEAAVVLIEPFGPGEPIHGACHRACAERAQGSLGL